MVYRSYTPEEKVQVTAAEQARDPKIRDCALSPDATERAFATALQSARQRKLSALSSASASASASQGKRRVRFSRQSFGGEGDGGALGEGHGRMWGGGEVGGGSGKGEKGGGSGWWWSWLSWFLGGGGKAGSGGDGGGASGGDGSGGGISSGFAGAAAAAVAEAAAADAADAADAAAAEEEETEDGDVDAAGATATAAVAAAAGKGGSSSSGGTSRALDRVKKKGEGEGSGGRTMWGSLKGWAGGQKAKGKKSGGEGWDAVADKLVETSKGRELKRSFQVSRESRREGGGEEGEDEDWEEEEVDEEEEDEEGSPCVVNGEEGERGMDGEESMREEDPGAGGLAREQRMNGEALIEGCALQESSGEGGEGRMNGEMKTGEVEGEAEGEAGASDDAGASGRDGQRRGEGQGKGVGGVQRKREVRRMLLRAMLECKESPEGHVARSRTRSADAADAAGAGDAGVGAGAGGGAAGGAGGGGVPSGNGGEGGGLGGSSGAGEWDAVMDGVVELVQEQERERELTRTALLGSARRSDISSASTLGNASAAGTSNVVLVGSAVGNGVGKKSYGGMARAVDTGRAFSQALSILADRKLPGKGLGGKGLAAVRRAGGGHTRSKTVEDAPSFEADETVVVGDETAQEGDETRGCEGDGKREVHGGFGGKAKSFAALEDVLAAERAMEGDGEEGGGEEGGGEEEDGEAECGRAWEISVPVTNGPVTSGPVASGPVTNVPVTSGPVASVDVASSVATCASGASGAKDVTVVESSGVGGCREESGGADCAGARKQAETAAEVGVGEEWRGEGERSGEGMEERMKEAGGGEGRGDDDVRGERHEREERGARHEREERRMEIEEESGRCKGEDRGGSGEDNCKEWRTSRSHAGDSARLAETVESTGEESRGEESRGEESRGESRGEESREEESREESRGEESREEESREEESRGEESREEERREEESRGEESRGEERREEESRERSSRETESREQKGWKQASIEGASTADSLAASAAVPGAASRHVPVGSEEGRDLAAGIEGMGVGGTVMGGRTTDMWHQGDGTGGRGTDTQQGREDEPCGQGDETLVEGDETAEQGDRREAEVLVAGGSADCDGEVEGRGAAGEDTEHSENVDGLNAGREQGDGKMSEERRGGEQEEKRRGGNLDDDRRGGEEERRKGEQEKEKRGGEQEEERRGVEQKEERRGEQGEERRGEQEEERRGGEQEEEGRGDEEPIGRNRQDKEGAAAKEAAAEAGGEEGVGEGVGGEEGEKEEGRGEEGGGEEASVPAVSGPLLSPAARGWGGAWLGAAVHVSRVAGKAIRRTPSASAAAAAAAAGSVSGRKPGKKLGDSGRKEEVGNEEPAVGQTLETSGKSAGQAFEVSQKAVGKAGKDEGEWNDASFSFTAPSWSFSSAAPDFPPSLADPSLRAAASSVPSAPASEATAPAAAAGAAAAAAAAAGAAVAGSAEAARAAAAGERQQERVKPPTIPISMAVRTAAGIDLVSSARTPSSGSPRVSFASLPSPRFISKFLGSSSLASFQVDATMTRALLLLLALSALLAAAAGAAAATKPPRSGGVVLRGGDGSVTGGAATAGGRGGSGDSHAVSRGDSRHGGLPGGGRDEEREEVDGGRDGHGGRGHDNTEGDSSADDEHEREHDSEDESDDDSEHEGGSSSHGGGLCGRGGCSEDSGEVGYWKLPDYGRCSIGTASTSSSSSSSGGGGAPRKADEAWCAGAAMDVKECCSRCSNVNATVDGTPFNCRHWVHIPSPDSHDRGSSKQRGKCVLLPAVDALTPEKARKGRCGTNTGGDTVRVGRRCAYGENDPHFLGAHGTRFDFNGLPRRSFCLYTDRHLHVNMAMRGYLDPRPLPPTAAGNRSTLAAARFVNGSAVRTWIRQLAIMWHDGESSNSSSSGGGGASAGSSTSAHTLVLTARDGKEQTRGAQGFLASVTLDNKLLPRLTLGESHVLSNGRLILSFVGQEKTGPFDVDVYTLRLENLLELELKLRAAHPLLQTPEDAQVHINLMFVDSNPSSEVHGVMGQTYRSGREQRTMEYSRLAALLHHPVSVDGEEGKGFLDGQVGDYETSAVTATDCRFSAFNGGQLPLLAE
ncbi:unnamed protein product [Closterium sp. Naga37s-1]|nr:unnamed protein product [Closterium sp. Naga37s-1]